MHLVPVRGYDPIFRRGNVGAVVITLADQVVRQFNGKYFVVVRVIDRSNQPKVLIIGQEEEGLIAVPAEDLREWETKGILY